ncbi:spore germination protein [Ureibacillus manganicus]|uniref:Spore gernimation protein n=1 Tax=Ureibacillus manganicus DSM 26584 TaxID=1384049 RepID=A0A0A3I071_9BACL|nr:spore germination protein [Ureibacillus manganicus]KGR78231.1 spore gernimation protein [Ureibacillus manganicus DSM 26584]
MDTNGQTITLSTIKQLFEKSSDVLYHTFIFNGSKVHFVKCDAMVDEQMLYTVVLPKIDNLFNNSKNGQIDKDMIDQLLIPELKPITNKEAIITSVYNGKVLIFFDELQLLYSSNIVRKPNRNPEETNLEALVKGPRDNFIEDISINIALIRKRFPSNSLCVEKLEIGNRTKTAVAILYVEDIANQDILKELKRELNKIDTDIIISADSLMEFINKKNWILPATHYTGRPDFAIQSLIRGRFLIMVDGTSYTVMTPVNFTYLLKSAEDYETPVMFSTFERILRLMGLLIGTTLPAFWIALTLFHQNQLPLQLLATVVIANRGLPLPAVIEMLLLLILFEMFKEATLRLPSVLGGTFSVVGGLIIGDAAIRSGITSPAMIVIIAISVVASYTIVNQSLVTMVSILRIAFILITAIFGLFGFFICIYLTILYIANMRIFGVPYLNVSVDLSWDNLKKTFFRASRDKYTKRPSMLQPQDKSRSNNEESK